jgi:hypothetical protein
VQQNANLGDEGDSFKAIGGLHGGSHAIKDGRGAGGQLLGCEDPLALLSCEDTVG